MAHSGSMCGKGVGGAAPSHANMMADSVSYRHGEGMVAKSPYTYQDRHQLATLWRRRPLELYSNGSGERRLASQGSHPCSREVEAVRQRLATHG